jgi:hypothetical protein
MAEWRLYKIARRAAIPRSVLCLPYSKGIDGHLSSVS